MSIASLTIKDGLADQKLITAVDTSGNGSGPFIPAHAVFNNLVITQTVVTLPTNTNTLIIAANPNRRYLAIMNIGLNMATLGFTANAVFGQGWPMSAANVLGDQGGGFVMEGSGVSSQAIYAISGANTTIVVLEG